MQKKPDPFLIDEDSPALTDEVLARMHPARELLGDAFIEAAKRRRGRPRTEAPKLAVKLRLDPQVVAYFRATGPGWQTRINEELLKVVVKAKP